MKRLICLMIVVGIFLMTTGADCGPAPPAQLNQFNVYTTEQVFLNGVLQSTLTVSVTFDANFIGGSPTYGTLDSCHGVTSSRGLFLCIDAKLPGTWNLLEVDGDCALLSVTEGVSPRGTLQANCEQFLISVGVVPNSIDVNQVPATIQTTGSGTSWTYGAPVIQIIDMFGRVVASATAYGVSPDGSGLVFPCPYVQSLPSGSYILLLDNVETDGSLQRVGGAGFYIFGIGPPPPPPPDGCGNDCLLN